MATTLEIIRGISQALAYSYDGGHKESYTDDGEAHSFGLKREQGDPILDRRVMDGFKVKCDGSHLMVTYQTELKLRDVYGTKLEEELEATFADIVAHLKSRYKKISGKSLSLVPAGECDALVQKTSNVRVFAVAQKVYKIGNLDGIENRLAPSEANIEKGFKNFLEMGGYRG